MRPLVASLLLFLAFSPFFLRADSHPDKVESPRFMVGGHISSDIPLLKVDAKVQIEGMIARVVITQHFANQGTNPLDAEYVFPGSSKSAVYGMEMKVGERVIQAKIEEKAKAKADFEAAKQEGKTASLLEQERPNVFQMSVANIQPGETIVVELKYTELLVPVEGVYEFVLPTSVGERYTQGTENEALRSSSGFPGFNIDLHLAAGMPVQQAVCKSHPNEIFYETADQLTLKLTENGYPSGDDFVFAYRLAGEGIGSGLSLYQGENENFFLLQIQPPKAYQPEEVVPREYIFIVDISGSMDGFPIETGKTLMRNLLGGLRDEDRFNLILFASGYFTFSETSLPATERNISAAIEYIEEESGSGGTELLKALERALELPRTPGMSRNLIMITDGLITAEKEAFDLIRNRPEKANFFAFGVGKHMNRYLIEGLAYVGQGEPIIITDESEAELKAEQFRRYVESPVLTDIGIDFNGFEVYDVSPPQVPDVFAERPVIMFGKWRGKPEGSIHLTGNTGEYRFNHNLAVAQYQPATEQSPLPYLWARDRIKLLSDFAGQEQDSTTIKEVTALGLKYNLLTNYTSFVAIDDEQKVEKPLKIIAEAGAVPEPHEWALILLVAGLAIFLLYRNGWKF